jgi:uncharacterized membrane protein
MKDNNQWIWIIVAVCAVLLISFLGFAGMGGYGMMGGFYGNMMSGFGMGLFGWLFMFLIIIALVLFIVWLIKQIQEPNRRR